MLNIWTWKK